MQKQISWQRLSVFSQPDLNRAGAYLMALFIVSIYVSTATAIVVSCLVGVWWLITRQFKQLSAILKTSPVAAWALVLYLCLFIGLGYGQVADDAAYSTIRKYRELSYIALLSCFFTDQRYRTIAWKAFIVASAISLAGSFLMDLGLMDMQRNQSFSLKSRITHSIFIAFFIYYCAHKAVEPNRYRAWFCCAALIGCFNLFFVVEGRTGQLIFIILAPLFAVQRFGKKGLLAVIIGIICFMGLFINYSDKSSRIRDGLANTLTYWKQDEIKKPVDVGIRFKYWQHAITLIAEKPLLGYGTGSYEKQYKRVSTDNHGLQNPHNEFLLITVQLGLLGLMSYCGFLFSQYYSARNLLRDHDRWLAQGLLLTLIVTSMFNSPLLDHAEGHWFAVLLALCHSANRTNVDTSFNGLALSG